VLTAKDFVRVLRQSGTTINVILSNPVEENDALEATNAFHTYVTAPKVPNIFSDHFWVCNSHGCSRYRIPPSLVVELEFHDLDMVDTMDILQAADPLPMQIDVDDGTPFLKMEDPAPDTVDPMRREEAHVHRPKRNIKPPQRIIN
jgi:hypothetical protein